VATDNASPPPSDTHCSTGEPRVYLGETLGAVYRRKGVNPGMSVEGRVAFAHELVQEARRQEIGRRLVGMLEGLHHGADPNHIARRMRRVADQVHPYYDCTCQRNWHPFCPVHQRPWSPDAA
jgi:hypothetical protein